MKKTVKNLSFVLLLLTVLMLVAASAVTVRAGSVEDVVYNTTTTTLKETSPSVEGDPAGRYGYMVFHPGAIAYTAAVLRAPLNTASLTTGTPYRRGSTDAWLNFVITPSKPFGSWDHFGGHQSSSGLWENEIWVDGFLKISNDANWRATCANHIAGNSAYCVTSFYQLIPRLINAKSNHHFHKTNYKDNNFSTADSA